MYTGVVTFTSLVDVRSVGEDRTVEERNVEWTTGDGRDGKKFRVSLGVT